MKKFVVFTAVSAGQAVPPPPPPHWRDEANFVVFQDEPVAPPGWERRPLDRHFTHPVRNALRHKILAHDYFSQARYSLWIDPFLTIKSKLTLGGWAAKSLDSRDLAVFRHPQLNCCYQAAAACIEQRLDSSTVIDEQMQKYYEAGQPARSGLADCTVLLRRQTPKMRRFNEIWHDEVRMHSRCEQLSFDYAARRAGLKYAHLDGTLLDNSHFDAQLPTQRPRAKPSDLRAVPMAFERPDAIILAHPRSGTHFLQGSLASHPKIFPRGEFLVAYANHGASELSNLLGLKRYAYANKPAHFNLGIIMYENISTYENLFGPLTDIKVIHLLRNAESVARSYMRMEADRKHYGKKYRKHYLRDQKPLPHAEITAEVMTEVRKKFPVPNQISHTLGAHEYPSVEVILAEMALAIDLMQQANSHRLESHPNSFVVNYDELTSNGQINELPKAFCSEILKFLDLDYHPLVNGLRKSGQESMRPVGSQ